MSVCERRAQPQTNTVISAFSSTCCWRDFEKILMMMLLLRSVVVAVAVVVAAAPRQDIVAQAIEGSLGDGLSCEWHLDYKYVLMIFP